MDDCGAIMHINLMYVPGATCEYDLGLGFAIIKYLKQGGNKTPTRFIHIELGNRGTFKEERITGRR